MNWLERNEQQQTYLSEIIKLNNIQLIKEYLNNGAVISIFVQGYLINSLVCTLPLTIQPLSSVFTYPPPLTNINEDIINTIDEYLNEWLIELYNNKDNKNNKDKDNDKDNKDNEEKTTDDNENKIITNIPKILQIGDVVKRGQDWKGGNEDGDPPNVGVVVAFVSPNGALFKNVAVVWDSGQTFVYVYEPNANIFEVEFVEVKSKKTSKKLPKFSKIISSTKSSYKIGDFVHLNTNCAKIGLITSLNSLSSIQQNNTYGAVASFGGSVFGRPFGAPVYGSSNQMLRISFLDGTVEELSVDQISLADGSSMNESPDIALIPGNRCYIDQDSSSLTSTSSSISSTSSITSTDVKCSMGHSMCLQSGLPFTANTLGAFGNPGFGGFGRMAFGQVVCNYCNLQNLQNEPCYFSCPMKSQCSFNICMVCSKNLPKSNTPNRPLQINDKVKLNYNDGSLNCLGSIHDKLIGRVISINSGYCQVECFDERSPNRGISSILETYLTLVIDEQTIPLQIGDRVVLTDEYLKKNKNHLNLGENDSGEKIIGIVIFAPPLSEIDNILEQRPIIVIPEKNINTENSVNNDHIKNNFNNNSYYFRSSWIERAESNNQFQIGDRVQLNPCNWKENQNETKGKCLGKPNDFKYGIIRSIGNIHNGIQRNIEVALISSNISEDESIPLVSFYPGYSLTYANLATVYNSNLMKSSLCLKISELIQMTNLNINIEDLVDETKLLVWTKLWSHCGGIVGVNEFFNIKDQWENELSLSWNIENEKLILDRLLQEELNDIEKESKEYKYSIDSNISPEKWSCKKCGYPDNKINDPICNLCSFELNKWECSSCLYVNSGGSFLCIVCNSSKERSDAINLVLEEELKKKTDELESKEEKNEEKNDDKKEEKENEYDSDDNSTPPQTPTSFGSKSTRPKKFPVFAPRPPLPFAQTSQPQQPQGFGFSSVPAAPSSFSGFSFGTPPPSTTTTSFGSFPPSNVGGFGNFSSGSNTFSFGSNTSNTSELKTETTQTKENEKEKKDEKKDEQEQEQETKIEDNNEQKEEQKEEENEQENEDDNNDKDDNNKTDENKTDDKTETNKKNNSSPTSSPQPQLQLQSQPQQPQQQPGFGFSSVPAAPNSFSGFSFGQIPVSSFGGMGNHFGANNVTPVETNEIKPIKKRIIYPTLARLNSNLKLKSQSVNPNINPNFIENNDEKKKQKVIQLKFNIDSNYENNKNSYLTELRWHTIDDSNNHNDNNDNNNVNSLDDTNSNLDPDLELPPPPPPLMTDYERTTSMIFVKRKEFVPFTDFSHLISSKDKLGNSILHHIAYMKLYKSYQTLIKFGVSKWNLNNMGICPEAIYHGIGTLTSTPPLDTNNNNISRFGQHELPLTSFDKLTSTLFEKILKRNIIPIDLLKSLFQMNQNYSSPDSLSNLIDSMLKLDKETSLELAREAIDLNLSIHSRLYYALALLDAGYGYRSAQKEVTLYYDEIRKLSKIEIDPLILYVLYMIGKDNHTRIKSDRLFTADALTAFRCFPIQADMWLTEEDNLDEKLSNSNNKNNNSDNNQEKNDGEFEDNDEDDDDDDDDTNPSEQSIAESSKLWKIAKENHKIESPSMDKLMELTGLSEVKSRAINVCKEVLLSKKRPKHIQAQVTMNFLFVGNPGTGKTTVATLLAAAMVELGYRKNPIPIITSANDILSEQDPAATFQAMVQSAENGTLFVDEAYHFNPAPRGSTANASNKVLDYLMKISETKRDSITFILAGYKEEILQLLTYNPGFPSRFPKELMFHFPDYTESQICNIFKNMVKTRNFKLESKKECGVSISRVVAQRIAKGSGKKGFGNGREVRVYLEKFITRQVDRLGTLELYNLPISENDYATLTRSDTIGERPDFESSPIMKELNTMIGLEKVKSSLRGLMNLQLQNYDNEMRGERIQKISLNRVFLGSSGTGKTTVARLYGRLLKEFGYLSDGDLIEVKPSDLKGQAIGEAATKVANLIDNSQGKVLFIDEAYGLDPTRRNNGFGGEVIDTLVEKLDRSPGADIAVILAGYEPQMKELFKNANNQGFASRFNLEEALIFEDLSNDNLKLILLDRIRKEGLRASIDTIDTAIKLISQRRRLDGFSNASEVDIILNRAKVKLATRKQLYFMNSSSTSTTSSSILSTPISRGLSNIRLNQGNKDNDKDYDNDNDYDKKINNQNEINIFDPYELIEDDFRSNETSAEKARDAFSDLENIDHILQVLQELEDTMNQAKSEGRSVADILDDGHMIFTGGPGTGKTTVAQRFGQMFYNLELLPRPDVEVVTAANLISRYMGNTGPNVVDAMRRAKGGILFIDEAYGMVPKHGSYGAEAIQALVDNITLPEFRGNLIIILGGYHESIEELFGINPGFRSRFDKRRIEFPSWSGEMATKATINQIIKDGLTITHEGKELLLNLYNQLSNLPEWGSARDVYRNIIPTMYSKRSKRLAEKARQEKSLETTIEISKQKIQNRQHRRREEKNSEPYTAIDIREAFQTSINTRIQFQIKQQQKHELSNQLKYSNYNNNSELNALSNPDNQIESEIIVKQNYKVNEKSEKENSNNDDNDNDDNNTKSFDELFEETIKELNLTPNQMKDMLQNKNYSNSFINLLKTKTNITNNENLIQQVEKHIEKLKIIQQKISTNGISDIKVLEKLRRIGKCPMLFDWIKIEGGYRCAGGSHYVSDYEMSLISDVI